MESKGGDSDSEQDYKKSESKGGGTSSSSSSEPLVSRNIQLFTDFCTSTVFGTELVAFEKKHCRSFKGADLEGEQQLEWTELHSRYVAIIEEKMDGFCKDNGLKAELLFEEVSRIVDTQGMAEFLPQVMLNCEYGYFAKQMKYQAEMDDFRDLSRRASSATPSSALNISGVYENCNDNPFDPKVWDLFLKAVGCP